MRIRRQQRTGSGMAGILGILGISRERRAGRRIATGTMTKKGIKAKPIFQKPGRIVFEEARRAKKK
jgi:hypothetical protein